MRTAPLVLLAWLAAAALAVGLRVPTRLEAADGSFVSIPILLSGEPVALTVSAPPGFKLLSKPVAKPGKSLVNFFVIRGTVSGEYPVEFDLQSADGGRERAVCRVFIKPRAEFAVEVPPGREIILGQKAEYWINLVNTGNVDDEVSIEVRMPDRDVVVEPASLRLAAGERGGFSLTVHPRDAQPFVVVLLLKSRRDPELEKYASLRTDVLPFAGAGELSGRALRYRLEAGGNAGSDGFVYSLRGSLGGRLSDYTSGVLGVGYSPGKPQANLLLSGDWGKAGLTAAPGGYSAYAASGDWSARLRYGAQGALWGSLGWNPGYWRFSVNAAYDRQRFAAGGDFPLGFGVRLAPLLFLDRYGGMQTEGIEPGAQLGLKLNTSAWLASARMRYEGGLLTASGEFSRRRSEDYDLRGYWFYNGADLGFNVAAGERLSSAYRLEQSLNFLRGSLGWRFGLAYGPADLPWRVGLGAFGLNLEPGAFARVSYRQPGWEAGGDLSWRGKSGLAYTLRTSFSEGGTRLTLAYAYAAEPSLGFALRHSWRAWDVSADYSLSLASGLGAGRAEIVYDGGLWSLKSGVRGDARSFKWWLGGGVRLEGGMRTPETVVQLFGGRKTGRVWGTVYFDENQNGVFDKGEAALAGAYVSCGAQRTASDGAGRYQLEAEPGECEVEVQDAEGRYGLPSEITFVFTRNFSSRHDLGLVPVAGVSGIAWLDADQNGARDEGERTLAGVTVNISGPNGFSAEARTDAYGRFSLSYLPPGEYRLQLASAGLPRLSKPAEPLEIRLEPGPIPFVSVRALPKELRKVQTFSLTDASLDIELQRQSAPPGAELPILVRVSGAEAERVYLQTADGQTQLSRSADDSFRGYLRVPEKASGVFFYRVVAETAAGQVHQDAMLVVVPGPLVSIELKPAFVDPGEEVAVTARFLRRVEGPLLVLNGTEFAMERQDDLTWAAKITAPQEPGRYIIELRVAGKKWAEAAFRVSR